MAKGMEFMVKALLDSMDPDTRAAIENIPKNVQAVAAALNTMDQKLSLLLEAGTCARLEAIEIAVVRIEGKLDGHTIRLEAIQQAVNAQRPGFTPDSPLPTIEAPPSGNVQVVDVVARQAAQQCLYADAVGPCKLPANHAGPHQCEATGLEMFNNGSD